MKTNISELLVILGTVLFVGGTMGYLRGALPAEQISGIGALALVFVGCRCGHDKGETVSRRDKNCQKHAKFLKNASKPGWGELWYCNAR